MNRKSEYAKAQWQGLKDSEHTHTIHVNEKNEDGQNLEDEVVPKGEINSELGNGTDIYIDLDDQHKEGNNEMFDIGHEEGHAARFDQGLVVEDIKITLDGSVDVWDMGRHLDNRRVKEETEASHIENIIRAQVDPSGMKFPLRKSYDNLSQYTHPFLDETYVRQININVVKPGYEYYKK